MDEGHFQLPIQIFHFHVHPFFFLKMSYNKMYRTIDLIIL